MTADQVRAARTDGYIAGYTYRAPRPNPYAPQHVPVWLGPRTPADRATKLQGDRSALLLARVWRAGYRDGLAAYGRDHGLTRSVS